MAVDGSVFKHHPLMKQRMSYYINKFAHPKKVYIDDRCQIIDGWMKLMIFIHDRLHFHLLRTGRGEEQHFWPRLFPNKT